MDACSRKRGVTLVEVLVVVIIMGILSGIGVAGLRDAVANSRIKDAGINVTAFMQRAANEATRLNMKLCATITDSKTLKLYKEECSDGRSFDDGDLVAEMALESSNEFVTTTNNANCPRLSGKSPETSITLTPKVGVSPIPSGCLLVRYGASSRFASAIKESSKFSMYYVLSYDSGENWFEP